MSFTQIVSVGRSDVAAIRNILFWTACHRVLVVGLLVASSSLQTSFDTSSSLLFTLSGQIKYDNWETKADWTAASILRWDTVHFLGVASSKSLPPSSPHPRPGSGLTAEHHFAFQPGIFLVMRACDHITSSIQTSSLGFLLSMSMTIAASLASPILLYM